jgi:hypothetical protein
MNGYGSGTINRAFCTEEFHTVSVDTILVLPAEDLKPAATHSILTTAVLYYFHQRCYLHF